MNTADFTFDLPAELIAQAPTAQRSGSRLLHLPADGPVAHLQFAALPELLRQGDLLVVNNTRVLPARLFASKASGGRVEIMLERLLGGCDLLVQLRVSKPPAAGSRLRIDDGPELEVLERRERFYVLRAPTDAVALLHRYGHVPLPPYIERAEQPADHERYQTVFAERDGAVAAPTAGLHFDVPLLDALRARGVALAEVTLHVGVGTFAPVRAADLRQHPMHAEWCEVPAATVAAIGKAQRVVAVGTTVVRALESAAKAALSRGAGAALAPFSGETSIFIYPGVPVRVVDVLITNFHLPRSTLLMLVCAFAGTQRVLAAYAEAVEKRYRFFSYGDAMLLERSGHDT